MKQYLNRYEREHFLMLASFIGYIKKHFIEEWGSHNNLSAKEIKLMRGAFNYSAKAAGTILSRLEPRTADQLRKDMKDVKIFCLGEDAAEIKMQEHEKEHWNRTYSISRFDLDELTRFAFKSCEACTENYQTCQLRQLFTRLSVEPVDPEAVDRCQYCLK